MNILSDDRFNMRRDELVNARVSALNAIGASQPSEVGSSQVQLKTSPLILSRPQLESETMDSFTISWNPRQTTEGYLYELLWDENEDSEFTKLADTADT